jgi:hypothetical protein
LEKCIEANDGTFEQELQECPKFHNDANLFHEYARFNTFWKLTRFFPLFLVVRLPSGIFVEVIVYCCSTV